jgi:hypothetical protein
MSVSLAREGIVKMVRKHSLNPSRRELLGGLAVLTILACVSMTRLGRPAEGLAQSLDPEATCTQPPSSIRPPGIVPDRALKPEAEPDCTEVGESDQQGKGPERPG